MFCVANACDTVSQVFENSSFSRWMLGGVIVNGAVGVTVCFWYNKTFKKVNSRLFSFPLLTRFVGEYCSGTLKTGQC